MPLVLVPQEAMVVLEGIVLAEGHPGAVVAEVFQGEALLEAGKKGSK